MANILTMKGHDFLDATRNETVWKKVKETVSAKGGGIPFAVLQSLAIETAKQIFLIEKSFKHRTNS